MLRRHCSTTGGSMRLDYLVVAFSGDLGLLRVQARSMARYLDPDSTGTIFIVNNDDDRSAFARRFEREIRPEYGALGSQVELLARTDLLAKEAKCNGYWRQQAIKLRGHAVARMPAYVTLDCKNSLIRPVGAATFLQPDGRLVAPQRPLRDRFKGSMHYFGVPEAEMPEHVIDIYTPVAIWREQAAALDAHIRAREGFGVDVLLSRPVARQRPRLFEFLIYGAFLHAYAGGIEAHHAFLRGGLSVTYMATTPEDPAGPALRALDNPRWPMMGVHRRTAQAPEDVRRAFAEAWRRFGLVASVEEGLGLLAPPAA
ncbi:DUF6492 family protein [Planktothrix agardhii 1811]|uniref:DUF6492 family protein n=1 Tax=Planktothrix agardhii TaxID=1160 RepID=UPI001F1FFC62|nr:DUF6492 family protein [Planktothrix agardhii]MCF3580039.1 DUF6492 family protein [Planktothrix agardhii 1811]